MTRATFAAALVISALFGGCAGQPAPPSNGEIRILYECPVQLEDANCRIEGDRLVIRDLAIQSTGGLVGIEIDLFATSLGLDEILIENVSLVGFPTGIIVRSGPRTGADERGGLSMLTIRGVQLAGAAEAAELGIGIQLPSESSVIFEETRVAGFHKAIEVQGVVHSGANGELQLRGPDVAAKNLSIGCIHSGLNLRIGLASGADLDGVSISNCAWAAVDMNQSAALAVNRGEFVDNAIGIFSWGAVGEFTVLSSRFERNGVAIRSELSGGSISSSVFRANGAAATPPVHTPTGRGTSGGIHFVLASGMIEGSSFSDNSPFAVASDVAEIQAPSNWWGSPLGPRIFAEGQTLGPGGDSVTPEVRFVPFLTEPPN